jgi:spore maturation protein CgeD
MKKGLISILLTSYNRPKMVVDAIKSVLNQTYQDFELIILDDNSEPETLAVLYEYINNPKVVFYKSNVSPEDRFSRPGYVVNINIGLKIAQGEFICYLPDDDYLLPNAFELLVAYLNLRPEISVVYGRQQIYRNGSDGGLRGENRVLESGANTAVDHCQVMHRASILEKTGEWPTHDLRMGDAAFWLKIHEAGYPFYPIQEVTSVHRYHANELSSKIDRGELNQEPRE